MSSAILKFERFLRINHFVRTSDIIRARAVYMIALLFLASQIINFILLTHTYGHWSYDHWVGSGVFVSVAASLLLFRYVKKFVFFAGFYSLLLFIGILLSSMHDYTGINTALLSFLVLGAIINGFISGWRSVLVYGIAAIGLIWYLYSISITAPTGALFDTELFYARNLQRAIQANIAFTLVALITSFASYHMHQAFFKLEEKIAQVEKAAKDKSQFLANLSHELRTPLNGVMGFSNLLAQTPLDSQQGRYAEIVNKSANSILAIVNDTLDLSKIDTGKFKLNSERFDLHAIAQSLIDLYQPITIKKGLLLGMRFPNDLPRFYIGDGTRIRQIINNFVTNAVKFTEHGSIYITFEKCYDVTSDYNVKISVVDTGIGIAEKNHKIVFGKFSQIDNSLSSKTEGTGLGLALCQRIVMVMEGSIMLESQLGAGSTFSICLKLPIAEDQNQPETKAKFCKQKIISNLEENIEEENIEYELIVDDFNDEAA